MADKLQPFHHSLLTDAAIERVYRTLIALFAQYDVPATFAFVMAMTLSASERPACDEWLEDRSRDDAWLSHYWRAIEEGHRQGWFAPGAFDAVAADARHEIACHGFCHRPLGEYDLSRKSAAAELDAALAVARLKNVELTTLIYPRNRVGDISLLQERGFAGYRLAAASPGRPRAAYSFLEEFNVSRAAEDDPASAPDQPVRIPAGRFFNWRRGARRLVPPRVTTRRWTNMLDNAAQTGRTAHLWFHPHNLITGPSTIVPLKAVLGHAVSLRDRGRLKILTQEDYCREQRGAIDARADLGGAHKEAAWASN